MNEWTNEWNGANEWQPEKDPKRGENVTGGREGRTRGDEEAKREKSKRGGEPAGRRVAVSCSETKRAKRVYWCSCASDKSVWSVCPAVCLSICLSVRPGIGGLAWHLTRGEEKRTGETRGEDVMLDISQHREMHTYYLLTHTYGHIRHIHTIRTPDTHTHTHTHTHIHTRWTYS